MTAAGTGARPAGAGQGSRDADPAAGETRGDRASVAYRSSWRVDTLVRAGTARIVPWAVLERLVVRALVAAGAPGPASIGLVLSGDAELATLNRRAMGKRGPTDVLSFPLLPPSAFPAHEGQDPAVRAAAGVAFALPPGVRPHLGDVVVSVERAIAQAVEGSGGQSGDRAWAPSDELRLLVVHGTLHVCGWDHALPVEEAAMRALERELLAAPDGAPAGRGASASVGRHVPARVGRRA